MKFLLKDKITDFKLVEPSGSALFMK